MSWQEQHVTIMTDRLSGATGITEASARMLLAFAEEESNRSLSTCFQMLRQMGRELLTAQSGMASLVTLFNRVFFAVNQETETDAALLVLKETVATFLEEQTAIYETIYRTAVALMPVSVSILTHSASSTVLQAILHANTVGRQPRVYCLESRPLFEGRLQAVALAEQDIETTLLVDSAIYAVLPDIELVLVGADSLTEQGVVGKLGTAGLAVCAQTLGIPCYVLTDTSKLWPTALGEQPVHERPPDEVWSAPPVHVFVQNPYYDITPWRAVSGVVTEKGLLTVSEIQKQCRSRPVHPFLQNIIAEVRSTT